jgi:hypothetical protein
MFFFGFGLLTQKPCERNDESLDVVNVESYTVKIKLVPNLFQLVSGEGLRVSNPGHLLDGQRQR